MKKRSADAIKRGLCRVGADGNLQLTLEYKRDILLNNIYGVDLDAQAVEVAQLSLYLKLLEEETAATIQPKLGGLREQLPWLYADTRYAGKKHRPGFMLIKAGPLSGPSVGDSKRRWRQH